MKKILDLIFNKLDLLIIVFLIIGILIIAYVSIIYCFHGYNFWNGVLDFTATTAYGTIIAGLVTPFWTLAGVLIYFKALKEQQKEINENRLNFEIQQFESKFFQLLKFQSQLRENLVFNYETLVRNKCAVEIKQIKKESKDVFKSILFELTNIEKAILADGKDFCIEKINSELEQVYYTVQVKNSDCPVPNEQLDLETNLDIVINNALPIYHAYYYNINPNNFKEISDLTKWRKIYAILYRKHIDSIDAYLNHFRSVVEFVDKSIKRLNGLFINEINLKGIQLMDYLPFLSSQMTQSEFTFLFYHSLLYKTHGQLYRDCGIFNRLNKENLIKTEHFDYLKGNEICEIKK